MGLSLRELKELLIAKEGYTIAPKHNQLQDLKNLVDNMMDIRSYSGPGTGTGNLSGTTCSGHSKRTNYEVSLGGMKDLDIKRCTCHSVTTRNCGCVNRTGASACTCNSRGSCNCVSRNASCSCVDYSSCSCVSYNSGCNCVDYCRALHGGCGLVHCVAKGGSGCFNVSGNMGGSTGRYDSSTGDIPKTGCASVTGEPTGSSGRVTGATTASSCTCNTRGTCDCVSRTSSGCTCNSRCSCNSEKRFG